MSLSNFRFPTNIIFGVDSIKQLSPTLKDQNVRRPLFVTDKSLETLDFVKEILQGLSKDGIKSVVFSQAQGNPVKSFVEQGVEAYKKNHCDALIMCGGGCALDVGKAIALMIHHPGDLFEYEDGKEDAPPVDQSIPYMVAIPTTAGTGSEVGGSSVISDDQTKSKVIIWSPRLIPNSVIADPKLTMSLPKMITAATGMDALTHNIEAFLAKNYHPMCDGIALEGIFMSFKHLKTACLEPNDMEARSAMLMASMMGAVAFQKGLGVTHSCAHALSTCYDVHHGLANAIMLKSCLQFNLPSAQEKFVRMAHLIGLKGDQLGQAFIDEIEKLKQSIGIDGIKGISVNDKLVQTAFDDVCHSNNPRVCTKDDFLTLFTQTFPTK